MMIDELLEDNNKIIRDYIDYLPLPYDDKAHDRYLNNSSEYDFTTPIAIKKTDEYYDTIKSRFYKYLDFINKKPALRSVNDLYDKVNRMTTGILRSFEFEIEKNHREAYETIKAIIKENINNPFLFLPWILVMPSEEYRRFRT